MKKSILYKWFKLGSIPKGIDLSNATLIDEGIKIVTTYKNFKAPGKKFKHKKKIFLGSIVLGKNNVMAFAYSTKIIDLQLKDVKLQKIDYSESTDTLLSMKFDVSLFDSNASGDVTFTFHTPIAKEVLSKIKN